MGGPGHTVFEDLVWIAVALAVIARLFACLAMLLAITPSMNRLAAKRKLITNARPRQAPQPAPFLSVRSDSLRCRGFPIAMKVTVRTLFVKLRPLGFALAPK
ncbi:MAG: hypothetical protein P8Z30_01055 [Acidobacteriota bacterium]